MFCRGISWILCILVAVVIAAGHCDSVSTEESTTADAECAQQLMTPLSVETAAGAAVLAVSRNCSDLRRATVAFLREHLLQVVGTQGWADAMRNHTEALIRVSGLIADTSTAVTGGISSTPTPTSVSQLHSGATSALAAANVSVGRCPTLTPNETALSLFRNLSGEEKGWRLIEAAQGGAVEDLQRLLVAGADAGARDAGGFTALHWAAHGGHAAAVQCLLAAGAEVDARNGKKTTPLHIAAWNGHTAVIQLLLAASADPNAKNESKKTPLHYAALNGHAEAASVLLGAGADRGVRDEDGYTPQDLSRQNNHQQLVDIL